MLGGMDGWTILAAIVVIWALLIVLVLYFGYMLEASKAAPLSRPSRSGQLRSTGRHRVGQPSRSERRAQSRDNVRDHANRLRDHHGRFIGKT